MQITARWEMNALVIESDDFSDQKQLDNVLPNSEDLKLIERIRLLKRAGETVWPR